MAQAMVIDESGKTPAPWFVPGDWDGFFALFFSGFPDLLLIAGLAPLCGFSAGMVTTRILPGVADLHLRVLGVFAAPAFALSYLAGAIFLVIFHFYVARTASMPRIPKVVEGI